MRQHTLTVEDRITGRFKKATARFYLHPDLKAVLRDGKVFLQKADDLFVEIQAIHEGSLVEPLIHATTYHPEFGLSIDNLCVEYEIPPTGLLTTQIILH